MGVGPIIFSRKKGEIKYSIKRNIFEARTLSWIVIFNVGSMIFIFSIISYKLELITSIILFLLLVILTITDYYKFYEGVYTNGVLIRGFYYSYDKLKCYRFIEYDESSVLLILTFKDIAISDKKYLLNKSAISQLNECLDDEDS
jgi:hypothetical protein